MQISLKKIISVVVLSTLLSSCMTSEKPARNSVQGSSQRQQKNLKDNLSANSAEFTSPDEFTISKADYKKATILNAELAIVYSTEGYLDRAKSKLIKAQDLSKQHGYNLAIVDYAAGYYYQSIGANSIAKKYYQNALYNHPKDFEAMNFYAQYLCGQESNYAEAQKLFDKSLYTPNNNDMAQTLFLYSQCMYKQGKKDQALVYMERANRFRQNYRAAKLRLAEMYFERKDYKNCYKVIYSMKDDSAFFNNKRILDLRLKLAEYAHNKNQAAEVRLILSSNNYNDEDIQKFFSAADQEDIDKNA
ncbi:MULTISPECIES: pilus assembly protein PilF [Francisella]|uniref:Pilus assembly protein PilF n=1 Tax=Francisella opportunistica TaxID=2016517 RepID=A0A345JR35_9GAMM|nr:MULTISPECIES: pilus assembly protein PilF [Francisella]APC91500.1 Type IV pili lipoprotein [Francisella sp. MA067296]AXH29781.1 pilus assembly protein PilF [Francisella opportunistica]AXH31431.1 pilus assembly protein PilF [Francisella opportunistica]AXH33077.1 pilus assembly protein PilF [Francisella opportunistica]